MIITMTANALQEDKDVCLKAGMDDFLIKPVKLEDMINIPAKWSNAGKARLTGKKLEIRA